MAYMVQFGVSTGPGHEYYPAAKGWDVLAMALCFAYRLVNQGRGVEPVVCICRDNGWPVAKVIDPETIALIAKMGEDCPAALEDWLQDNIERIDQTLEMIC